MPAAGPLAAAQRWRRIKQLFAELSEASPQAREAPLARLQAEEPELADELRRLLRSHDEAATGFLESPPATPQAAPTRSSPAAVHAEEADLAGRVIGPYRLVSLLGRGGMGAVYRAEREEDGKCVAIKLLRAGPTMRPGQLRAERRILAALEHDNIARLIDGGSTDEGQPYFTLEYVEGLPILRYCEAQAVNLRGRLALFRTLCDAVHYAHQRLVVHRDIKPGNVLVTAAGTPKLLDFGIARLLGPAEEGEAPTLTLLPAMTPEYASPEQVRGEPAAVATDVYALGLLLYELLSGERAQALRTRSADEIVRVVCEREPPRPSSVAPERLRRALQGDLDAIVMKALRKEPGRRYTSAQELGDDVGRHLEARPVRARAGERLYRVGRLLRRRRGALLAAAAVTLAVAAGVAGVLRQARIAEAHRRRAEERLGDVRRLAGSFLFEVHDAVKDLPGATPARRLVVSKALEYLDRLARDAGDDPTLLDELVTAYARVGDVQGYPSNPNLGDTAGAEASYARALELAQRRADRAPQARAPRLALARILERLGSVRLALGRGGEARVLIERAHTLLAEEARREATLDVLHDLQLAEQRLGDVARVEDRPEQALEYFESAIRTNERALAAQPADRRARRNLNVARSRLGDLLLARDPVRTLALRREILAADLDLQAGEPDNAALRRDLATDHEDLAQAHAALGQWPAALAEQRRALAIREGLLAADPRNEQAEQDISVSHAMIGELLAGRGRHAEALASYRRSLAIDARIAARNPASSRAHDLHGSSHVNVADELLALGRWPEAQASYQRALAILRPLAEAERDNASLRRWLADVEVRVADAEARAALHGGAAAVAGRARAREGYTRALALWEAFGAPTTTGEPAAAVRRKLAALDGPGR